MQHETTEKNVMFSLKKSAQGFNLGKKTTTTTKKNKKIEKKKKTDKTTTTTTKKQLLHFLLHFYITICDTHWICFQSS